MKLRQLLTLDEETTSSSVATYNKPLKDSPLKRKGFMQYTAHNSPCKGCEIIKEYGWTEPTSSAKELICTFCGTVHKKKGQ